MPITGGVHCQCQKTTSGFEPSSNYRKKKKTTILFGRLLLLFDIDAGLMHHQSGIKNEKQKKHVLV